MMGAALGLTILLSATAPKPVNLWPAPPPPTPNFLQPVPPPPRGVVWQASWLPPDPNKHYAHTGSGHGVRFPHVRCGGGRR
jgi:hypothetical protein